MGYARRFGAEIVNFADDFVVCGQAPAEAMLAAVEGRMEQLRLRINAAKTRRLRGGQRFRVCVTAPLSRRIGPHEAQRNACDAGFVRPGEFLVLSRPRFRRKARSHAVSVGLASNGLPMRAMETASTTCDVCHLVSQLPRSVSVRSDRYARM